MPKTPKVFWASSQAGLCNRLTTYVTCHEWAAEHNRELKFTWLPTKFCHAHWDDLFIQNPIITRQPIPKLDFDLTTLPLRERTPAIKVYNALTKKQATIAVSCHLIGTTQDKLVQYNQHFHLIPLLQDRVEHIARCFGNNCLGVHVRHGDHIKFGPKAPKMASNLDLIKFSKIMMMRYQCHKIFLATDDGALSPNQHETESASVEDAFRNEFGNKLIIAPKRSLNRSHVTAIQDAAVDLWSLKRCGAILGTKRSTFSMAAAQGKRFHLI